MVAAGRKDGGKETMMSANYVHAKVFRMKWSREQVLSEARGRTKELYTDNPKRVQEMLAGLLAEAGWSEDEFIDALCQDVIRKGVH